MCMTEQSELAYKAMDETAEWGVTHLRQPRRDNVIPMPTKPVHELQAHVEADPEASLLRDFLVMWSGIDWFWTATGALAFVSGVLTIVCGMLALATLPDLKKAVAMVQSNVRAARAGRMNTVTIIEGALA